MTIPAGLNITSYANGDESYHHGTLFDGAAPNHLGPYQIGALQVPAHWWNAVVRVRKNPITVIRTPAQIVAARRMFPFGNTGCKVGPQGARSPFTPMGSSDVTIYMPTTGERPSIGLVTDNSGFFMLGGDPLPMLDWAQANDSCPHHFRDETTGKPIDLLTYPKANAADLPGLQGSPFLLKGPPDPKAPQYTGYGGGWGPQQAHFCEMAYVAYMATGDLGFLENAQYNANFTVLCDATLSNPRDGAIVHGETRGIAWALRNLFMAHVATQDAEARGVLPDSCHPSSYFKKLLDQSLAYYSRAISDPALQTFRLIGEETGRFSPWTCDYLQTALAFGVLTGHSDWAPLFLWCLGNPIARTNGTSGYPPGFGTSYRLSTRPLQAGTTYPDMSKPQFANWGQAFAALLTDPEVGLTQAQYDALMANPLNGGKAMTGNESMMTTRAALVMTDYLDKLGLITVRQSYPEFDTCLANAERMFQAYGLVNPRVSVVSDPNAVPVILPPLPAPSPEPVPIPTPTLTPTPVPVPVPVPIPSPVPPATWAGIAARVSRLKTIVGVTK